MYFGFEHLQIRYGRKEVLHDVTLEFPRGQVTTVIGQNGSGKSSMFKTVSRAVKPSCGRVILEGRPLNSYPPKQAARKIAILPQLQAQPPELDVRTLVSYGRFPYLRFGGRLCDQDRAQIRSALEVTGLNALQHQSLGTLSGGERQRAWIAMTVCQQPEILILDEPTTHLDISYQIEVLELVRSLNRELGLTIIMVLHDLNLAARYSDYMYAIKDGGVAHAGTPSQMITEPIIWDLFQVAANIGQDGLSGCPFFIPFHKSHKKEMLA